MNCIVFSRNRAMQLDACVRSILKHAGGVIDRIRVLYTVTSESHARSYHALRQRFRDVEWHLQRDFRTDLADLVDDTEYTVFHTDDDIYFASSERVTLTADEACFTFRLGLNTTYCYPLDLYEQLLSPVIRGDRVTWRWRDQPVGAYSYPLALNGHVLRTVDVRSWVKRASYRNPNELEEAMQQFNDELPPLMSSFRESRVVSIPANLVNDTHANRASGAYAVDDLNARFLRGERIDIDAMDFSSIVACHQEIPFAFRRAGRWWSSLASAHS